MKIIWQLAIMAILFSSPAFSKTDTITVDQVIQESLQKNTDIFRIRRDYDDKIANTKETISLDNPELKIDAVRTKGQNGMGSDIEFTQPIKFSQISGARNNYANALLNIADMEQKYEILQVINKTAILYTQLWLLIERKKLYDNYTNDAEKMQKLVKETMNQGQTSVASLHLFASDAAKLKADAKAIEAELQQTRIKLTHLMGRNFKEVKLKKPIFAKIPKDTDKLVAFAQTQSNIRNMIKNRLQTAKYRLNIAKQDAFTPEFGPHISYSRSPNSSEQSYGIGVALRIPLWNQNDAERKRAYAELHHIESEIDLYSGVSQQEIINELQQSAISFQSRADIYFNDILPGYRKSYDLMRNMFSQGQVNAIEVWQIREKLLNSENEALDAFAQAINARNNLELELGGKIEEIK